MNTNTKNTAKDFDILVWKPEEKIYELTGCVGTINEAKKYAQEFGKRIGGTYFKILTPKGKTLGPFEIN